MMQALAAASKNGAAPADADTACALMQALEGDEEDFQTWLEADELEGEDWRTAP